MGSVKDPRLASLLLRVSYFTNEPYTAGPLFAFDFPLCKGLRIGNMTTKDIQYIDQKPPGCIELHFLGILSPPDINRTVTLGSNFTVRIF